MGRKKTKDQMKLETFYSEIESWSRTFTWKVNRRPWEFAPYPVEMSNEVTIEGKIFHISSNAKKRREFRQMRLHLIPSSYTFQEWAEEEVDRIGAIFVQDGILCGSAFIPEQAHATLIPSLAADCFKEMVVTVLGLGSELIFSGLGDHWGQFSPFTLFA